VILDTSVDPTPRLPALRAAGVTDIFCYLNPLGQTSKAATPARAKALAGAGIRLGLVSEGWGDFAHGGISAGAGERDADHALEQLPLLGAEPNTGVCVYFAVDVDASEQQVDKLVLPYFAAVGRLFAGNGYEYGCYGSGLVCSAVGSMTVPTWLSCSMGWSGSTAYRDSKKWFLRQHTPSVVAGLPCDVDDAAPPPASCGTFIPFARAMEPRQ